MTDILFYHLERQPLELVLPVLLHKTLERGWTAVVHTGSPERAEALSSAIWTFSDDAFIPHGTKLDGHADRQPIWLTGDGDNPNNAQVRFFVDGAPLNKAEITNLERVVYMFDGHDGEAVEKARQEWKAVQATGLEATYWQQDESGRWQKKA